LGILSFIKIDLFWGVLPMVESTGRILCA